MADACYTAHATTKQQVLDGIEKLTLLKNENGQYTHNAILLFQKGITRVLVSQFNPSDPGNGMKKLLDDGDSPHESEGNRRRHSRGRPKSIKG